MDTYTRFNGAPVVFTALYRTSDGVTTIKLLQANSREQLLQRVRKLKPFYVYNETYRRKVDLPEGGN